MTEKSSLTSLLQKTPALHEIIKKYGEWSVYEYAKTFYHTIPENTQKQIEFIALITKYSKSLFGEHIGQQVALSLSENFSVSTADHHGPIGHPFFFQSSILRGLTHPKNAIVNLCTSHVSLGNSSYPRSFIIESDTKQLLKHLTLPIFPATSRQLPVFGHRGYTKDEIYTHSLHQLKTHFKNGDISSHKYETIYEWIHTVLLSDEILSQKFYSHQITLINYHLWKDIFGDSLPAFIGLDAEDFLSFILSEEIIKNDILDDIILQNTEAIEASFDTLQCCFDREQKKGTYLFWGKDATGKRHSLWRKGNTLVNVNETFSLPLSVESIITALREKQIIPSGLLVYSIFAGYYKVSCFGGFAQGTYLPHILNAFRRISGIQIQTPQSILCEDIIILQDKFSQNITALDILNNTDLQSTDIWLQEAKKVTLQESIQRMIPEISRCLGY